jgi:hypothetical protein
VPRAGVINQHPPHNLGGDSEEVRAVLPLHVLPDEAEEGFVNEVGGLERVAGPLPPELAASNQPQLAVDEREELFEG